MKTVKKILYPHIAILIFLLPISVAFLIYSMTAFESNSAIAITSYVVSAYTLTVWCFRIPHITNYCKKIKNENKVIIRWHTDVRWRVNITLFAALSWNTAYAIFQLWLGVYHKSLWYYSAAAYYFLLGGMRLFLVNHSRKYEPGQKQREELIRYRLCGWIFLLMNVALAVMIALNVWGAREFRHHQITTIAMAAYTFATFTFAIINLFKYRKYNSPLLMASRSISLASASVSMLTLTSSMLTVFGEGDGSDILFRRLMIGLLGGSVSLMFIIMAIFMIVNGTNKLRNEIKQKNEKQ